MADGGAPTPDGSREVTPDVPRLTIPANASGLLDIQIQIARCAMQFFYPGLPNQSLDDRGKPSYDREDSTTGEDLRQYMLGGEDFFSAIHSVLVHPTLRDMARANLLYDHGVSRSTDGILGHAYQTLPGAVSTAQRDGSLWLSKVLGPALIIGNYSSATAHITGTNKHGDITNATALVLDPGHLLTNAHVVKDCAVDSMIRVPTQRPPAATGWSETPQIKLKVAEALVHDRIDVAVIPVDVTDRPANALKGVAFRNPEWSEETYVFGFLSPRFARVVTTS